MKRTIQRFLGPALVALALVAGVAPAQEDMRAPAKPPPEPAELEKTKTIAAPGEFRDLMRRGRHALKAEENGTAADIFTRCLKIDSASAAAHFYLGQAMFGLRRSKTAKEEYLKALEFEPGHSGAILGLATIDEKAGDYEAAERRYREAIAIRTSPWAQRSLGALLGRVGRTEEAEKILKAMLDADPADADTRYELALALSLAGRCEEALPEFQAVLASTPDRTEALFQVGRCLGRMGRTEEAQETLLRYQQAYEKAGLVALQGREVPYMIFDADQLAAAGDMKGALLKARQAVANAPDSAKAHAFYGSLLIEAGRNGEALDELRRASELDPTDAIALTEVGRLLGLLGRYRDALGYFERAVRMDAELAPPHQFLSILYQQMGRGRDAARHKAIFERLMARQQQQGS